MIAECGVFDCGLRIAECGVRSVGRAADVIDRHDRDRHVGVLASRVGLTTRDEAGHVAPAGALNLERRALRVEARLLGERAQPALHQVRAEVVEQQEAAEQRERHEQQRRHEADEDIGEDQLAPDAPEKAPLGQHDQPGREVGQPDRRDQPRHRVDDGDKGRNAARGPDRQPDAEHRQLDRHADDDRAAGERVEQRPAHARTPIDGAWRQRRQRALGHLAHRGLRAIKTCIVNGS